MPSVPFANVLKPAGDLFRRLTIPKAPEVKMTVGLDIDSVAVKAVALGSRRGGGVRPLIGQSLVPLRAGQESDPSAAIKEALSELGVPVRTATLGVSGQWVVMRIVEMPTMRPGELKQSLAFEAQRYLPFNLQEVVIDGVMLGPADASKTWVLIVACKKELLQRRIDWAKRAGVEIDLVDVDALAVANGFLANTHSAKAPRTCAIINVGVQITNLVILKGQTPHLVRDIPWGGEKLTRAVAEQMGIDADAVARQLAQPAEANAEMATIRTPVLLLDALKLSAGTLVTELQLSFDYFENRFNQPPDAVLVSGELSQSKSFLEALKSHLTQPVTPWSPVSELSGQFAIAYGLALRTG